MAVETADDLAVFFNTNDFGVAASKDRDNLLLENGFSLLAEDGSQILFSDGSSVNGIFDNDFVEVDAGGGVGFALQQPRFVCRTADVSTTVEGDSISINSVNYTIRIVQDDGTGVTTLVLEKQ